MGRIGYYPFEGGIHMSGKVYTPKFKRSAITLVTEQKNKPDDPAATL